MQPTLAMLNGWEVVAILAVVLIIFGAKKLPELAKGLGQGIKEFKKSSREIQDEIQQAIDLDTPAPPPKRAAATPPPQDTAARMESPEPEPETVPPGAEPRPNSSKA